jgi:hypothetical protein
MELDKQIILSCAFRYALGRKTYVVSSVVNEILKHWDEFPKGKKEIYCREIKEAIKEKRAGMDCDVKQWKRVLEREEGCK